METNNKRLTYGICVLALSALLLTWISHSGHKAEAPKEAPIPWKGVDLSQTPAPAAKQESPAEAGSSSGTTDAGHSSTQPPPRPASPSPPPPSDAASAGSSLPYYPPPSYEEEGAPADSDATPAQPQETAAQRVGRQLRRH
jgi:hypothetical protein